MSGKGRRGAPPLPRQRRALRVVQLTLIIASAFCIKLGLTSAALLSNPGPLGGPAGGAGEVAGLFLSAAAFAGMALWMGIRTVRGPQPPTLE